MYALGSIERLKVNEELINIMKIKITRTKGGQELPAATRKEGEDKDATLLINVYKGIALREWK